ncbi:MAG: hypothetical protein COV33_00705 [Candidatus Zambryskibacteria bacterium CG10_big_fil_rev_8_21_14_0_10_34_34]|uniref:Uncharacterized protein n=1 Tax=Candidatus Zambryskibacteria bacterium CG10_big_fil_rev_8_21_14_0_10_34_34 TaxID=1975114 RepID=A0A2H0R193_9BACT|nr:MAG: hypothetical protein COV33_00705 [Candidatus Zambryskibacteria bacterium CG10_big_fil_rev_8_21_14_0_10_34_34]
MESNCSISLKGIKSSAIYFAKRNLNVGDFEKMAVQNPARIPPQTSPAGGKSAETERIHSPRKIVRPADLSAVALEEAESKLVFRILLKKSSSFV